MKTGKSIIELALEIQRQSEVKKDFIADTSHIRMFGGGDVALDRGEEEPILLACNSIAHRQIGEFTGIPVPYYDRMLAERPELLAQNVNSWMGSKATRRMVRTLDGTTRAFLSDKYRPLENTDLAEAVLPILAEAKIEVLSCEITERRLYIKGVDARINADIPTGKNRMGDGSHVIFDTVSPAIIISNSEVGMGSLSVETAIWTRACTNMAIFAQKSLRKTHVGARLDLGDGLQELLSDRTKRITDAAVWSQVQDVVRSAFDEARFKAMVAPVGEMAAKKITGNPVKAIELMGKRLNLTEGERGSVLRHLIEGGDLSQYGVFNAVTRTAEDLADYDRATDFERLGGQLIELPANDWKHIAEAA
jgi:hypothetical protein